MSLAYLGPVEWNRSGVLTYGLWVHIAPGVDRQPGDIRAPGALSLVLDDGPLPLSILEAPKLGADPYRRVVSWGQTAYYGLTTRELSRMAASTKLQLDVRATDGSAMAFSPLFDSRGALTRFVQARGVTAD